MIQFIHDQKFTLLLNLYPAPFRSSPSKRYVLACSIVIKASLAAGAEVGVTAVCITILPDRNLLKSRAARLRGIHIQSFLPAAKPSATSAAGQQVVFLLFKILGGIGALTVFTEE